MSWVWDFFFSMAFNSTFLTMAITTAGNSISLMRYNYHRRKQQEKGTIPPNFLWFPHPEFISPRPPNIRSFVLHVLFCVTTLAVRHNKTPFLTSFSLHSWCIYHSRVANSVWLTIFLDRHLWSFQRFTNKLIRIEGLKILSRILQWTSANSVHVWPLKL